MWAQEPARCRPAGGPRVSEAVSALGQFPRVKWGLSRPCPPVLSEGSGVPELRCYGPAWCLSFPKSHQGIRPSYLLPCLFRALRWPSRVWQVSTGASSADFGAPKISGVSLSTVRSGTEQASPREAGSTSACVWPSHPGGGVRRLCRAGALAGTSVGAALSGRLSSPPSSPPVGPP